MGGQWYNDTPPFSIPCEGYCDNTLNNAWEITLSLLALAALGGTTQAGSFLLAKASKEGDVAVAVSRTI